MYFENKFEKRFDLEGVNLNQLRNNFSEPIGERSFFGKILKQTQVTIYFSN